MVVQDGLREAGGAGGEVDGAVVLPGYGHSGRLRRAVADDLRVAFREGRTIGAHEEARVELGHLVDDRFHPAHELRPEHQRAGLGQLEAVFDLLARIAVVHGNGHGAGFEDAEVDG